MKQYPVIAAVRTDEAFHAALSSAADTLFLLATNIEDLKHQVERAHLEGKKIFIHIDLAEGIGKDEYGIRFVKSQGADGIISTRTNLIKLAKKAGMFTVQRFFIVDSQSIHTTVESAKASKADMIEIMPGTVSKVISYLKSELKVPVVAGGLMETEEEIHAAIESGATAVSVSKQEFWNGIRSERS